MCELLMPRFTVKTPPTDKKQRPLMEDMTAYLFSVSPLKEKVILQV